MQEVKEGGQRRHSGASGRARCSPGHSCCYKRCLNPQALAQPHSSRPHADQLLCASVRGAWEQMPAKSKAPGPPLTPLLPDPPPHPPSATPHLPRPNRMAGQEAGVSTLAPRNQTEKGPHETKAVNSALCPTKQNGKRQRKP